MQKIHEPHSKEWIYQKKVNVKEFLENYVSKMDLLREYQLNEESLLNSMRDDFDLDEQRLEKLSNNCLIGRLDAKGEEEFFYNYRTRGDSELIKFDELETLNARRSNLHMFKQHQFYRIRVLGKQKYRTNYITFNLKEDEAAKLAEDRIDTFESLLTVQIFNPISVHNHKELKSNNFIMNEFHVLGSQNLCALKDIYQCVSDLMSPVDCSRKPDISKSLNKAEDYTSSFFFINDCFYVDSRLPTNIDYSEVIRSWAAERDRQIGPFDRQSMENTKFEDLDIQLGYPYLYLHQGNCEHLLVFSDLRLHNKKDFKYYSSYPCRVATVNRYKSKCALCELNAAKWIVYENQRLPHSPFFFCENCFKSFNYNEKGEMIGIFKAYPYIYSSYNV